ncbi:SlyX family protein [Aestuariicella sp. G3-2]|uniref:SlyX family protein n=1 Tax=Pseudomaricurvus albidus TaxID=2842452 RepID=UPI001C0BAC03|nr:SlyX family protein [Aestuariicella albida]MBU3069555.1 SlyX family protein [Aestuariicella albida]
MNTPADRQEQLQQQIEELETRLAFQEDTLNALDQVIAEQDRLLSRQQMQLQLLAEKFKTMESRLDDPQAPMADERPPHY